MLPPCVKFFTLSLNLLLCVYNLLLCLFKSSFVFYFNLFLYFLNFMLIISFDLLLYFFKFASLSFALLICYLFQSPIKNVHHLSIETIGLCKIIGIPIKFVHLDDEMNYIETHVRGQFYWLISKTKIKVNVRYRLFLKQRHLIFITWY